MRLSVSCFLLAITLILASNEGQAQSQRYLLKVRGGEYVPEANAASFDPQATYMSRTTFGSHHYVVLQFSQLPSFTERTTLAIAGIELMEYIPELSYTARIKSSLQPSDLLRAGVRSVTYLKPENKTVPALLQGLVPSHAGGPGNFSGASG
jgi:hypothetical protein